MKSGRDLITVLKSEKKNKLQNGIYHKLQIDFAYNSNHIEGSRLTHEQTRYIFETKTVGLEPARVDDIIETANHFKCFDFIIDTFEDKLTADYIKKLHYKLKSGTFSAEEPEAVVGDYKKYPNEVGVLQTTSPECVAEETEKLLEQYHAKPMTLYGILDFHVKFEKIHPFYDGNGRVGRLIMFKECLKNKITPFYIRDEKKLFYYRGLKEWEHGDKAFLADTCLMMQDIMKENLKYFEIGYDTTEYTYKDILSQNK